MNRVLQFSIAIALLAAIEILRVYYIMPFPGSQEVDNLDTAYFIHQNVYWLRFIGLLMIAYPVIYFYKYGNIGVKILVSVCLLVYVAVFYLFNFKFVADKMFHQPEHKTFLQYGASAVPLRSLVLGVVQDGEARAYPIELIGYHHQVRDTVGKTPIMVTYCTVCRTGRVYSPLIDGVDNTFRLVGMDHYNAMFEDAATGSWWRQVTGEAVTGPLRGKRLREIPAQQMRLEAWIREHPDTYILQPDSTFSAQYDGLSLYDEGETANPLTRTDSSRWHNKSWVVGLQIGMHARAYAWNDLVKEQVVNDTLAGTPVVLALNYDGVSFHVWKRDTLRFVAAPTSEHEIMRDEQTQSHWNTRGECTAGPLQGRRLERLQAYQEFWHSWRTFHSNSTRYKETNSK